jgi:hypothetical protein
MDKKKGEGITAVWQNGAIITLKKNRHLRQAAKRYGQV